jgi:hypothetical protein
MNEELIELLKHFTPAEARQRLNLSARDLDAQVLQLTASLNGQEEESPEGQTIIAYVDARIDEPLGETGARVPPLNLTPELEGLRQWVCCYYRAQQKKYHTPEFLEWARQSINEEEILAAFREIQATGGLELKDFIHELEQEVSSRE